MTKRSSSKIPIAILLLGSAGALGYPYWPFNFCSISICDTCGVARSCRERQIPLFPMTWRTTHGSEQKTGLSGLLMDLGRVPPHEHTWQFARGAGNGTMCAIGRGQYLYETVRDERAVRFLRFLSERESSEFVDSWISFALDHRTTFRFRSMMFGLESYPDIEQAWLEQRQSMESSRAAEVDPTARYPR
jgi:hypothetical protein